MHTLNPIN